MNLEGVSICRLKSDAGSSEIPTREIGIWYDPWDECISSTSTDTMDRAENPMTRDPVTQILAYDHKTQKEV